MFHFYSTMTSVLKVIYLGIYTPSKSRILSGCRTSQDQRHLWAMRSEIPNRKFSSFLQPANPTLPLPLHLLAQFQAIYFYFNSQFDNRDRTILIQLKAERNQL